MLHKMLLTQLPAQILLLLPGFRPFRSSRLYLSLLVQSALGLFLFLPLPALQRGQLALFRHQITALFINHNAVWMAYFHSCDDIRNDDLSGNRIASFKFGYRIFGNSGDLCNITLPDFPIDPPIFAVIVNRHTFTAFLVQKKAGLPASFRPAYFFAASSTTPIISSVFVKNPLRVFTRFTLQRMPKSHVSGVPKILKIVLRLPYTP
jgi:hypothetical protein